MVKHDGVFKQLPCIQHFLLSLRLTLGPIERRSTRLPPIGSTSGSTYKQHYTYQRHHGCHRSPSVPFATHSAYMSAPTSIAVEWDHSGVVYTNRAICLDSAHSPFLPVLHTPLSSSLSVSANDFPRSRGIAMT